MRLPDCRFSRDRRGFSMFDVLITLAIASVLVMIAYPGYVAYKVRANRAATQALLIDLANRQQIYMLDARGYASTLADLGASSLPTEVAAYYVVADPVVDNTSSPPNFVISASARAGTIQGRDGDLGINSTGIRSGHW